MALVPGTRLGPYEIVAPIGAGGMGQVWSARDTRLDRTVAIKVSAEQFTERFDREARNVAALNHPNICTLFDVGPDYLVMELIEGPTLAERIAFGAMPLEEALAIARQIAEALEAAHERGIVHRDLKPANIKFTTEGNVKVLDFGLAKARDPESSAGDPASSPTLTLTATRAGMIIGTAGYMSPEQARGKAVDRRADIWSFGVVLYEMLCGSRLYSGELASDLLAAVILKEPDWSMLPAATPARIRELLQRCLRKDPKSRLRDIGDARIAIEEYLAKPDGPAGTAPPPAAPRRTPVWLAAAAVVPALALAGLSAIHFSEKGSETRPVRFLLPPPDKTVYGNGLAISPDGRRLAYVASNEGRVALWVRSLDSVTPQLLSGTDGGAFPFWSPDSRFIGFFVATKLKKVEASGGPPQTLCDVPNTGIGGSWNRDGVILFGTNASGLFRVSQAGGAITPVTALDKSTQESFHGRPWFLPDGRHYVFYTQAPTVENNGLFLANLDSKDRKLLASARQGGAYAPPAATGERGHVLFLREGTLMAQPLDPSSFETVGDAFPVAEQVGSNISNPFFSVSATGTLVYRGGGGGDGSQLAWFDREGKLLVPGGPRGLYNEVTLSPDGKRVAASRRDTQLGNLDLWLSEVEHSVPTRFTFDPALDSRPVWSPDGSRLVFSSNRAGVMNLYRKGTGGAGPEEPVSKSALPEIVNDWSADGRYLLFTRIDPKTGMDLWVLPDPDGPPEQHKPRPVLASPFNESQGQFSPGPAGSQRWIAYTSDESGQPEIYVQPLAESSGAPTGKFQISSAGGSQPRWRRDGKELYYMAIDSKLMAVELKLAPRFEHGTPKPLFQSRMVAAGGSGVWRYDAATDGKRFLIITQLDEAAAVPLTVVLHWPAAFKR